MIRHYTVVVPSTPAARAAIYGSLEEFQHFGNVVGAAVARPIAGAYWGAPTVSGNATPLCAWGVWATQDTACALIAALPTVIAGIAGAFLFTWDDASGETPGAYTARWKAATGWQDLSPAVGVTT